MIKKGILSVFLLIISFMFLINQSFAYSNTCQPGWECCENNLKRWVNSDCSRQSCNIYDSSCSSSPTTTIPISTTTTTTTTIRSNTCQPGWECCGNNLKRWVNSDCSRQSCNIYDSSCSSLPTTTIPISTTTTTTTIISVIVISPTTTTLQHGNVELNCYDNFDNDGDDRIDCRDSDCADRICSEAEPYSEDICEDITTYYDFEPFNSGEIRVCEESYCVYNPIVTVEMDVVIAQVEVV